MGLYESIKFTGLSGLEMGKILQILNISGKVLVLKIEFVIMTSAFGVLQFSDNILHLFNCDKWYLKFIFTSWNKFFQSV